MDQDMERAALEQDAFIPDLGAGSIEAIADSFSTLTRMRGLPDLDLAAELANGRKMLAAGLSPDAHRQRLAMFALSLTGASNASLRKSGDARRWYAMLAPTGRTLADARFFLVTPGDRSALVTKGLYQPFNALIGKQLLSLPVAVIFWVAVWRASKDPTPVAVGVACAAFVVWLGTRRWIRRTSTRAPLTSSR